MLQKPREHYAQLLAKEGLSIDLPFKVAAERKCPECNTRPDNKYGGGNSVFEIPACNFVSLYMKVPRIPDKLTYVGRRKPAEWKTATKKFFSYTGQVYSLDVEQHHTYVSNGIITHNCPFADRCPLQQIKKAPIGRQCLIEVNLMKEWIIRYIEEYDIDPNNFTEVAYVNELAEIEVLLMRLNMNIAKVHNAELVIDQQVGATNQGEPILQKAISPFIELKDRLQGRRSRIIKLMVGDRQEKYKKEAALKVKLDADPSSKMSQMRTKIENLTRQLNSMSTAQLSTLSPEDLINEYGE
jgi:hypothetical protein